MFKGKVILVICATIVIVGGIFVSFSVGKNEMEDLTIILAFLAVIYPIFSVLETSIENSWEKNKVRKVVGVEGTSFESLNININKELKKLKGKDIITVEIYDNKKAIIMYY